MQQQQQQSQQEYSYEPRSAEQLNQQQSPEPYLLMESKLYSLKKDWEAAFNQKGQEHENINRLIQQQLSFFEKQFHLMSEQSSKGLKEERENSLRLQDKLDRTNEKLEACLIKIQNLSNESGNARELDNKYSKILSDLDQKYSRHVLDLENRNVKLEYLCTALQNQQSALSVSVKTTGQELSQNIAQVAQQNNNNLLMGREEFGNSLKNELEKVKDEQKSRVQTLLQSEIDERLKEKEKMELTVSKAIEKVSSLTEVSKIETERELELQKERSTGEIQRMQAKLDKHLSLLEKSHTISQHTILSTIKTMSGSITNLRREIHTIESRLAQRVDDLRHQLRGDLKSMTRPIIIH